MRWKLLFVPWLFVAVGCQGALELPESNVCWGDHIKPLVKRDCSACHESGEWGVKLQGSDSDWPVIRNYVAPEYAEGSTFLWYAFGFDNHPIIWTTDSAEYRTFAAWVNEGALFGCGTPELDLAFDSSSDTSEPDQRIVPDLNEPDTSDPLDVTPPQDLLVDVAPDIEDIALDLPPDIPDVVEPDEVTQPPLVSFANDISPLHKVSCYQCHGQGQNHVKIAGNASDYPRVMGYVDPANPEVTAWQWASGKGAPSWHASLPKWNKTGSSYLLFLQWVKEGAQNN